jgi:Holliday junction resolvase RusA-like endonuclease
MRKSVREIRPLDELAILLGMDSKSIPTFSADTCDKDFVKAIKFVTEQEENNPFVEFEFEIAGNPPFSKRPRSVRIKDKNNVVKGIRVFAPDGEDQDTLATEVKKCIPRGHVPFAGEVELCIYVYKPMPQSFPKYKQVLAELGYIRPDKKPDYDNYAKIITDSMRGLAFLDDAQVVIGIIALYYTQRPRLEIVLKGRRTKFYK